MLEDNNNQYHDGSQKYGEGKQGNYGGNNNHNSHHSLPDGYLQGGYYSDPGKRKLKPEYIVKYPKALAKAFNEEGRGQSNKRTQIRKFYEYLLRVRDKMESFGNDYSMVEADFATLIPQVSYACQRKVVSPLFVDFITKNIDAVHDEKDLRAFVKHFESIIAFTKKEG